MSYHTAYPNWDSQTVVCHLFLYSFICAPTTAFTWLSKFCTLQLSSVFYLSWELSWRRVSFSKGDLQFSKNFKNTICIGLCKLKCTEKRFIPFTPSIFSLSLSSMNIHATWNVLYHTSLRNYAVFSLQVPSILSILLGGHPSWQLCQSQKRTRFVSVFVNPRKKLWFFLSSNNQSVMLILRIF